MSVLHAVAGLSGLSCLALATAYALLAVVAAAWRMREPQHKPWLNGPPVTVLKPLCGFEPGLYESLRSFCQQDYPTFQVVFGVRDSADPALAVVERLMKEFPSLPMEVVVNAQQHGSNRKVSNLSNMLGKARYDLLVIADSDVQVGPDYLATVIAPLRDKSTGLVTCLYRSVPVRTGWSLLGAMYVNEWYMPSVLVARMLGHRNYASGQTLCLERETLDRIGGLRSIANHLADDYQLGAAVRALGKNIVLSSYMTTVEQYDPSLGDLIHHETRWMRTIRVLRPTSFAFLFITFSLPMALVGFMLVALQPQYYDAGLILLLVCANARIIQHRLARTREFSGRSGLLLVPVRDLLIAWVWFRALFTSHVTWRGERFEVDVHGEMRGGQV